jgi:Domain of unknown function (DUF4386)
MLAPTFGRRQMTRRTNARVAGITFLLYIALGIPAMVLSGRATHGEGIAAKLASLTQHATDLRVAFLLDLTTCFCALVLAVTLYAITRDQDRDLATLALACRVGEGLLGGVSIQKSLGLLWLVTAAGADAPDAQTASTLGTLFVEGQGGGLAAIFFAVGSTLFSWLLLRGRMIPTALAWLGVVASLVAVVGLPLLLVDFLPGSLTWFIWIPLAAFEIPLALWLIIKGAALPAQSPSA